MAKKAYDSKRDDYKTPAAIYQTILDFIGIDKFEIDVCCTDFDIPANRYYTKKGIFERRVLTQSTHGLESNWWSSCFMNPPFKFCPKWVKKAAGEVKDNDCEVWAVLPTNRCEAGYYQEHIFNSQHCMFAFLPGKQGFIIPGQEDEPTIPSQGIMIACFSKKAAEREYAWNSEKLFNTKAFLGGQSA